MAIFKAKGLVLRVIKLSEKELLYKIFFREYGILSVKKKKKVREKPIDTGYLLHGEIITQFGRDIHTIGNIKILCFFDTKNRVYSDIERFLKILSLVHTELPAGIPHIQIYDILSYLIENTTKLSGYKLLLTQLKISQSLGNLPEKNPDETTQKILKFIHNHSYQDIMRLGKIPKNVLKNLEEIL
ncbi:recombination protein O N-terminal domain-containing protein [Candidatus Gracilibacteria bacterium]|nr:recombination protein O N-terminal domain-containing protein [Candidatus Gracilibacteria bacterium]